MVKSWKILKEYLNKTKPFNGQKLEDTKGVLK
jgi:hypothetical protein